MKDLVRQSVLVDVAYEIGGAGLAGFVNFLKAYREERWASAASELRNSLLYSQVPRREQENVMILTLGEFPAPITCARELIKKHEGCTLTAIADAKGKWEIGYGHSIPKPEKLPMTWTQERADSEFEADYLLACERAKDCIGAENWIE